MLVIGTQEEAIAALRTAHRKIEALQNALKKKERPVTVCPDLHVHLSELTTLKGYLHQARKENITLREEVAHWKTLVELAHKRLQSVRGRLSRLMKEVLDE